MAGGLTQLKPLCCWWRAFAAGEQGAACPIPPVCTGVFCPVPRAGDTSSEGRTNTLALDLVSFVKAFGEFRLTFLSSQDIFKFKVFKGGVLTLP